jgi:ABC-2 type transport system permease protein
MLLVQSINVVQGVAVGLRIMNSAAAIVIYFVLPTVWSILVQSFNFLHMLEQWLDLGTTSEPLYNFAMTGSAWLHLGSSVGVWLLLPLGAGIVRLLHQEVK